MSVTRINAIPQIETALRTLEAFGYDVSATWSEHNAWLAGLDTCQPTEHDIKWALRNEKPSSIEEHFIQMRKFPVYGDDRSLGPIGWRTEPEYGLEQLSAANAFADRQFTLSPGQRDYLRERFGLTPTTVVVLTNAQTFKSSHVLFQLTIKSAEHVDPRRRSHVLNAATVRASEFFAEAARLDKEREARRVEEEEKADKKRIARGEKPVGSRAVAMQYFEG